MPPASIVGRALVRYPTSMSKSEQIRSLAKAGLSTSAIAEHMGIRYQHVYNVLKQSGGLPSTAGRRQRPAVAGADMPEPTAPDLTAAGTSKSEQIRSLAKAGLSTSQIAERMGIRYQHAYNVLKKANDRLEGEPRARRPAAVVAEKPPLLASDLAAAGFSHVSRWRLDDEGLLIATDALPKEIGVYAFAIDGVVKYVGVATMGLAKRLYFYAKPGASQRTSVRLNEQMRGELSAVSHIDILVAMPHDLEWNGLPVHGAAGLELGLIKKYALPWNMRSAG